MFDIEDPFSWGFADARRLVFALAVANKRLYYSVEKPLQVWSVDVTGATPTQYVVNVSAAIDPASLQAGDFTVNGKAATGVSYVAGATTIATEKAAATAQRRSQEPGRVPVIAASRGASAGRGAAGRS